jgi:hypothetical protein
MCKKKIIKQIKSKQRVSNHGEVFTNKREVNAMLDLVRHETERIDSKFLEPTCGSGNFLVEILNRKLQIVEQRYKRSQSDFEKYSIQAISCMYGVDLLKDNIAECKSRLFQIFDDKYKALYKKKVKDNVKEAFHFILDKNMLVGDALTLLQKDNTPIIFSEWSNVKGGMVKRRDYIFEHLLEGNQSNELSLFEIAKEEEKSDIGKDVFIPKPIKDYPMIHFLKLKDNV